MLPDLASLHSGAWAIEEGALRPVLSAFAPEALGAYIGKPLTSALKATVRGSVAVLPVEGPLFKKPNFVTEILGFATYQTIRLDLQTAIDDAKVKAVLLNINSPGGEVQGTAELAQAIRDVRGTKPIVAYAGDLAASAAYWIASAADKIVIGPSAGLGSIGVIAGYQDTSVRDARSGVQAIKIVSSQSPYKQADPTTDDGLMRIQARVDALADVFVDAVASNRGVPRDTVLSDFGKGDIFIGKAAINAGLADEIGSFESVLASLVAAEEPVSRRPVISATRTIPVIASAPKPAPLPPHVAAERARGLAISHMGRGKHEGAASLAINEGWSVERFKGYLADVDAADFVLAQVPRRH